MIGLLVLGSCQLTTKTDATIGALHRYRLLQAWPAAVQSFAFALGIGGAALGVGIKIVNANVRDPEGNVIQQPMQVAAGEEVNEFSFGAFQDANDEDRVEMVRALMVASYDGISTVLLGNNDRTFRNMTQDGESIDFECKICYKSVRTSVHLHTVHLKDVVGGHRSSTHINPLPRLAASRAPGFHGVPTCATQ